MGEQLDWFTLPWKRDQGSRPVFRINGSHYSAEVDGVIYVILSRGARKIAACAKHDATTSGDYLYADTVKARELYAYLQDTLGKL